MRREFPLFNRIVVGVGSLLIVALGVGLLRGVGPRGGMDRMPPWMATMIGAIALACGVAFFLVALFYRSPADTAEGQGPSPPATGAGEGPRPLTTRRLGLGCAAILLMRVVDLALMFGTPMLAGLALKAAGVDTLRNDALFYGVLLGSILMGTLLALGFNRWVCGRLGID